jgi:hypothetical protein
LFVHWVRRLRAIAIESAGAEIATSTLMMAITTSSSTSVIPGRRGRTLDERRMESCSDAGADEVAGGPAIIVETNAVV